MLSEIMHAFEQLWHAGKVFQMQIAAGTVRNPDLQLSETARSPPKS